MGSRRASVTAVAAVVGVVLATVLVTWAASIGPGGVLTGDGPSAHLLEPTTSDVTEEVTPGPPGAAPEDRRREEPAGDHPVLTALAIVVEVGLGLLLLHLLYRGGGWLIGEILARRRPHPRRTPMAFEVLDPDLRVLEEIHRGAAEQRAALLTGDPRNGIVACWDRFERRAAAAGMSRHEWETSSEFTLRVLDAVVTDTSAVERLAVLYREARFSDHPVAEESRAAALEALDAIHESLNVPTGGGS